MKELVLPVPETVSATYIVPVPVPMSTVEPAGTPPPGLLDKPHFGTPGQRVFLARARAFVQFSATQRTSLIGLQEWKARGPAAALAARVGAPCLTRRRPRY